MTFTESFRVMVRKDGRFVGTGQTDDGYITIEHNIIHQKFYPRPIAERLMEELEENGWEAKLEKGS